jgi:AbrB family looped-hinge helix DNA binding protein
MTKKTADQFFGATTMGEKGQVVIPCDARNSMKLESGDKFLVFGLDEDTIVFTKLSQLQNLEKHLSAKWASLKK